MIRDTDFKLDESTLKFKSDEYLIKRINRVRVKINTASNHIWRVLLLGGLVSSLVWVVAPPTMGLYMAPVALVIGFLIALAGLKKYELQIEFQHNDGTGTQWVSIAKTNDHNVKGLLEEKCKQIESLLNTD
ncbi:hypothetical protein [Vibrio sp. WXL103]|uniref:hypothetical protein n=1 Tax=Vibrio sp. WXL103 TaxID=3450710 RepID=UPI003EC5C9AE